MAESKQEFDEISPEEKKRIWQKVQKIDPLDELIDLKQSSHPKESLSRSTFSHIDADLVDLVA